MAINTNKTIITSAMRQRIHNKPVGCWHCKHLLPRLDLWCTKHSQPPHPYICNKLTIGLSHWNQDTPIQIIEKG